MGIGFSKARAPSRLIGIALAALLMIAPPLGLTACASSSYAGIPFAPGAADPELRNLAQRAQAGDKQAQLELGIRYEEGRGVPVDLERALAFYQRAAADTPLSAIYTIPGPAGALYSDTLIDGLPAAQVRYCRVVPIGLRDADCSSVDRMDEVLVLASYHMNFRECAERSNFGYRSVNPAGDVRACLIESVSRIECGESFRHALRLIQSFFEQRSDPNLSNDEVDRWASFCSYPQISEIELVLPSHAGPPGRYLSPLEVTFNSNLYINHAIGRLGQDTMTYMFQEHYIDAHYNAILYMTTICRGSRYDRGFVRNDTELQLCTIVRGRELQR